MKRTVLLCWTAITAFSFFVVVPHAFASNYTISAIPNASNSHGTHVISGDGKKIFFASVSDPVGQNADGNMEVFAYDVEAQTTYQITQTQTSYSGWWNHSGIQSNFYGTRLVFRSVFALHTDSSEMSQYDIFQADITWTATGPNTAFQRLTTTDERLAMALSGNGQRLFFASRNKLTGEDNYQELHSLDSCYHQQ